MTQEVKSGYLLGRKKSKCIIGEKTRKKRIKMTNGVLVSYLRISRCVSLEQNLSDSWQLDSPSSTYIAPTFTPKEGEFEIAKEDKVERDGK